MKEPGNMKGCFYRLVGIILIVILSFLLSGCKSIQYVPVETTHTVYQNHTDTVRQNDTIISEKETIIREADSSLVAKLGLQLKANEKAILILKRELERQVQNKSEVRSDTVIQKDTIQVPYPVEKQLTKWQQFKLDFADVGLGVCALVVLLVCGYLFVRKRT